MHSKEPTKRFLNALISRFSACSCRDGCARWQSVDPSTLEACASPCWQPHSRHGAARNLDALLSSNLQGLNWGCLTQETLGVVVNCLHTAIVCSFLIYTAYIAVVRFPPPSCCYSEFSRSAVDQIHFKLTRAQGIGSACPFNACMRACVHCMSIRFKHAAMMRQLSSTTRPGPHSTHAVPQAVRLSRTALHVPGIRHGRLQQQHLAGVRCASSFGGDSTEQPVSGRPVHCVAAAVPFVSSNELSSFSMHAPQPAVHPCTHASVCMHAPHPLPCLCVAPAGPAAAPGAHCCSSSHLLGRLWHRPGLLQHVYRQQGC